jgi:O-antigen ligase
MFIDESINLYKLYVISAMFMILFLRILSMKIVELRISRKEITIFLMFALIALHAFFFSADISKSTHIFHGIFWLAFIYVIKINFGVIYTLKVTGKGIRYASYFILFSNVGALVIFGSNSLSVANNFHGVFQNANYMATLVAVVCFPFFLGSLSQNTGFWQRSGVIFLICLSVILVVFSRSRTSIAAILVTAIVYFIYFAQTKGNWNYRVIKKIISLIFFGLIILLLFDNVVNKYEGQGVFDTRQNLFELRLTAIAEKPVYGWGFAVNKFSEYDEFHIYNSGEKGNTLLAIFEELGLLFGSIFICYLCLLFGRAISVFSKNKITMQFSLILVSSVVQLQAETWLLNFNGIMGLLVWTLLYLSLSFKTSTR